MSMNPKTSGNRFVYVCRSSVMQSADAVLKHTHHNALDVIGANLENIVVTVSTLPAKWRQDVLVP